MLAATYARYSSDRQREASLEDQARNCRRRAAAEGWTIVATYEDRAISGATAARPGYQTLLADALAGRFGAVLIDDLSRLSRDTIEAEITIRRLEHAGVVIVGVSDGYDSRRKSRTVERGVRNLLNAVYLEDLADKTRRGLEGQARQGHNAGGRCYGYRHVPAIVPGQFDALGRPLVAAVDREIDPDQARWILRIFERYAAGKSPATIAAELNVQGVPAPRGGTWASSAIYGSPGKTTGILRNPLYAGHYLWNRSEWTRDPDTKRRVRRERPRAEWVETELPALRIVPEELWHKVQARLQRSEQHGQAVAAGIRARRQGGRIPRHLFSGLLYCAHCGSHFTTVGNSYYGCSAHKYRGNAVCPVSRTVKRRTLETHLLAHVRAGLIPDRKLFEVFVREARAYLRQQADQAAPELDEARRQLAAAEGEIENLIRAIASGIKSPALLQTLEVTEARRAGLAEKLASADAARQQLADIPDFLPRAADAYSTALADIGAALDAEDVDAAREALRGIVGDRIEIRPGSDCLEAVINKAGTLQLVSGLTLEMVAGAGFCSQRRIFIWVKE